MKQSSFINKILTFQMAGLVDRFNSIALIERFNHVARMQPCGYEFIEMNINFGLIYIYIYISNVDENGRVARVVLSIMTQSGSCTYHACLPMYFPVLTCMILTKIG
jgi:hypothetical protein